MDGSNGRINGLRRNGEDDIEDEIINEDDLLEVVEVNENDPEGDLDNEMDMLDVDEEDPDNDSEHMEDEEFVAILPERDDASLVFSKHTDSVFCVDVAGDDSELAVTGGEDDKAYVWNTSSGEVIFECTGHKDSVTSVSMSHNSELVATGDLSGFIQVWSILEKKAIWSFEVSDLEWTSWHHSASILLAGTVDGDIWMWKIPNGDTKTFQSFGNACNIGKVMPDGKRAVVGYGDGTVRVWDLKAASPTHTFTGHAGHVKSITSICCHHDNNLVMTGSTDCSALLLNSTAGKVVSRFQCQTSASSDPDNSVEAVGLSNILPYAATGTLKGSLDVWDIPTQVCRQHCQHQAGIVKLFWSETEPLIYTCSLDGTIQLWDSRSGICEKTLQGHEAPILDLHVSKNGSKIVSTSDDHTARVYTLT